MMNSKHTPGPWGWWNRFLVQSNPDGSIPLNAKMIMKEAPDFFNEADSALVAAAPEMLEALESAQEIIRESFRDAGGWCGEHRTEWVCPLCGINYEHADDCPAHLVDKAIAKATGGAE